MPKTLTSISPTKSLVDLVEQRLTEYFQENDLQPGDPIPRELELSEKLGVGRSVVREALSRFRMLGIIESRTKRGMILLRPQLFTGMKKVIDLKLFSKRDLLNIIEFRISLEIGIAYEIIENIREEDIKRLTEIVLAERIKKENNIPSYEEDYLFHTELHNIASNPVIKQFYDTIVPVLRRADQYILTTTSPEMMEVISQTRTETVINHQDIIDALCAKDIQAFQTATRNHLAPYKTLIKKSIEIEERDLAKGEAEKLESEKA